MNRLVRTVAALAVGSVVLSGCDFDVYELPLPGGTDVGSNPMTIEVEFENVLDLVPQSSVKVNDVSVGRVTSVELDGYTALVTVELPNDTVLPADTEATIRQTSLLGEKFVSLAAPVGGGTGKLANGDTIELENTGKNPEIEEVLGALSLLLNGGGIAKLKTIAQEVNLALEGREDSVKSVLTQIASLMSQLDDNKEDIVDAITSLRDLALQVREQQPSIDRALDELPSALLSIDRQREDLVDMLQALDRLGDVGVRVIRASKESTISSLKQLQPTLTQLANSGDDLVNSFNVILTYPFVDEVVGRDPQVARNLHMGDYTNLSVQLDIDLTNLPELPGVPCMPLEEIPEELPIDEIIDLPNLCAAAQDVIATCLNDPSPANCEGLPAGIIDSVCESLPTPLPGLCGAGGGGGGGGGLPGLPGAPGLPGGVPDLPDLPGIPGLGGTAGVGGGLLNRPAVGPEVSGDQGPTMGQLMARYDPALVSLLTPGMVIR